MTKKEARKEAYRQIVKENRGHQEVFEELRGASSLDVTTLANVIGAIPSVEKRQKNKVLAVIFIVVCSLVLLLRVFSVIGLAMMSDLNMALLLIALALGLVVPIVAIIGMVTWRVEMITGTAALLVLSLVRAFTNKQFVDDPINLVAAIPHAVAIVLAFLIPYLLKTGYKETVITEENDGSRVSRKTVVFEQQEKTQSFNLLDS